MKWWIWVIILVVVVLIVLYVVYLSTQTPFKKAVAAGGISESLAPGIPTNVTGVLAMYRVTTPNKPTTYYDANGNQVSI